MNERKKEVLMSFKSPIRPNKSIHLEMLSHLGEEQTKISINDISKTVTLVKLWYLNIPISKCLMLSL